MTIYTEAIAKSSDCSDCQGCPDCPEWTPANVMAKPLDLSESAILELDNPAPETFRYCLRVYHGIEARYDVRAMKQQVRMRGSNEWLDLTDGLSAIIRSQLAKVPFELSHNNQAVDPITKERIGGKVVTNVAGGVYKLSDKAFGDLMNYACAVQTIDPLVEYLENLPKWDRQVRLADWIGVCFDVAEESDDLVEWASQFVFLGAVWRAMKPGCKLDEMPILIGKGGIGKSTALRYILPEHLREMFTDGLNLAAQPKERIESLQGRAIVEAGEMQGARRADMESLKTFLSRTDDGSTRLAYRHNPESMPRRCVIIGTADRSDPLPDDHNLRRFVPVTLTGGDVSWVIQVLNEDRKQLWAEALHLFNQGVTAYLPSELKDKQSIATEAARAKDSVLEDSIMAWLANAPDTFSLENVAIGIGLADAGAVAKLSTTDSRRIAGVLRANGYSTKPVRIDGRLAKRWAKVLPQE